MTPPRAARGIAGERFVAWWLTERGLRVERHNVELASGEIDLLGRDGRVRVAIEVRTVTGSGDPIDAIGHEKRARVRRLAAELGVGRVDFVGLGLRPWGAEIHWLPG